LRSDEGIVTNELAEEGVRGTVGAVVIDKGKLKKVQFFEFESRHSEEFLDSFNLLVLVLVEIRNKIVLIIWKDSFQSKNYLPEIKLWFKKYVDLLY
jgi:hypothetical protein